jgi:protocatechuate 3,4-dioxygenase beta subunit
MTRHLNRREALAGFGTVRMAALLTACGDDDSSTTADTDVSTAERGSTTGKQRRDTTLSELFEDAPSCALTPEETEGPFYFDADAVRSDIREDRKGVALRLAIRVRDAERCEPLSNAVADIWHCDALGSYSGFGDEEGERYLRGVQVTNSDGIAVFTTIYPGWYMGRTVHIHAKVHLDKRTLLTTQFYFPEDTTEAVYERKPYSSRTGRDTFNDSDGIFDERTVLKLSKEGEGYLGLISLDVERA